MSEKAHLNSIGTVECTDLWVVRRVDGGEMRAKLEKFIFTFTESPI